MASSRSDAKRRLGEYVDLFRRIEEEHDKLVRQRGAASKRRLSALYTLFENGKSPSIVKLKKWLVPPTPKQLTDFKFYKLHKALDAAIAAHHEGTEDPKPLPTWVHRALGMQAAEVVRLIEATPEGEALSEGRGPSAAATELLAGLLRFGGARTIWRRVERHRKSIGEETPRPHRPRRPVTRR